MNSRDRGQSGARTLSNRFGTVVSPNTRGWNLRASASRSLYPSSRRRFHRNLVNSQTRRAKRAAAINTRRKTPAGFARSKPSRSQLRPLPRAAAAAEAARGRNSRPARATINKAREVRGNASRAEPAAALSRDVQFVLKGVAQVDFHELTLGHRTNLLQCRCYSPLSIYSPCR